MIDNTSRLETLILQLSSNFTTMSKNLEKRMDDFEIRFEEKISEKVSEKISSIIDKKLTDKMNEVKTEVKQELNTMQNKIKHLEKQVHEKHINSQNSDKTKYRLVIKNLEYDEREETETKLTEHKVQSMLKDCLGLANIGLTYVSRKVARGKYPGVVIVETDCIESKKEIMKNKSKLKQNRQFDQVYIENDLPVETRNFQNAVRTVLKEMGKDKKYMFAGSRLLTKRN